MFLSGVGFLAVGTSQESEGRGDVLSKIPRRIHMYWGDRDNFSWLNLLSVRSLRRMHPDWSITLWYPKTAQNRIPWKSGEQRAVLDSFGFFHRLEELDITFALIDFDEIGFSEAAADVHKSDFARYYVLWKYGGIWTDCDIVFIRPLEHVFTALWRQHDTFVCFFDELFPVGFMMASQGNALFLYLMKEARSMLKIVGWASMAYQDIGIVLWKKRIRTPRQIGRKFPQLNVFEMNRSFYLPYAFNKIEDIFSLNRPQVILNVTFGIHWFNGSPTTRKFVNLIGKCSICKYLF